MRRDYEYIVLGLGGFGSAAAYWLSRRAGADVLGLEQFELGHVAASRRTTRASSGSRTTRRATSSWPSMPTAPGPRWSAMRASSWCSRPVVSTSARARAPSRSSNYSDSMDAAGVPTSASTPPRSCGAGRSSRSPTTSTACTSRRAASRWRRGATRRTCGWRGSTARRCVTGAGGRHPAGGGEIEVTAGGATYRCRRLVIAAGPWSNRALAPFGVTLPLRVTKEQVTYFATPHQARFPPDRFPVWIWMDDPCFYGFPTFGEAGPKAGQDAGGHEVTADTRDLRARPGRARPGGDFSRHGTFRRRWGRSSTPRPACTPYARSRLRASTRCRATRRRRSPSAAGTGSSSPR